MFTGNKYNQIQLKVTKKKEKILASLTTNTHMRECGELAEASGQSHSEAGHTVCCKDDYFPEGKFKLFNSLFRSVTLFFQKVCFLLPICLLCITCGSYVTKINALLWRSTQQTFMLFGLFTWLVYVRLATLNLNKRTQLLCLGDA